jgi:hypothetical protein
LCAIFFIFRWTVPLIKIKSLPLLLSLWFMWQNQIVFSLWMFPKFQRLGMRHMSWSFGGFTSGSFGEVFRGIWRGTEVAIKVMLEQDLNFENTQDFCNEISILRYIVCWINQNSSLIGRFKFCFFFLSFILALLPYAQLLACMFRPAYSWFWTSSRWLDCMFPLQPSATSQWYILTLSCCNPHKLLIAWTRMLLTFWISYVSWLSLLVASGNATETQHGDGCVIVCLKLGVRLLFTSYTHHQELMKSVGSHGSLLLLLMVKVMVWHFVSNPHKVMTTPIIMLSSKCCCAVFSETS